MNSPGHRLSRPVYEALPWIYILCGLAALVGSWFHDSKHISLALGLPGLLAVLGGIVVALRRRDYRQMKANNYMISQSGLSPQSEASSKSDLDRYAGLDAETAPPADPRNDERAP